MAQKQSVFGRMSQLLKANVNALIDKAEDPQKMDRSPTDSTTRMRSQKPRRLLPKPLGNCDQEQDLATDRATSADWGSKELAGSPNKADEARNIGNAAEADGGQPGQGCTGKQISFEDQAKAMEPAIAQQNQTVEQPVS